MKIDTNVPPTDSWASLQVLVRLLQAGQVNETEFYAMAACLRAAEWTYRGGADAARP